MRDFVRYRNYRIPTVLAITAKEQEKGLMGENNPPPAMAFIYGSSRYNSFWMKSTPSPLDIIFCQAGKIVRICRGEPHSTELIGNGILSDLVIEMPYGSARNLGMCAGDDIEMEYHPESTDRIRLATSYR